MLTASLRLNTEFDLLTEQVGLEVTLWGGGVSVRILAGTPAILTEIFCVFPQFHHADAG
jgi:hypothetical protein